MDVVVTGIGLLSCLGSLEETWSELLANKSGIKRSQPFLELPSYPLGQIATKQPLSLENLTLSIVTAALKNASLQIPLPECGVVIGSSRGCQIDWEKIAREKLNILPSYDFFKTLPHAPAIATARYIQTAAPVLSPMAACVTGIQAIARGYELIKTGRCQRVIVGAVETPITPLTLASFERMGALAKTGCYPFDKKREGLVLGEGGGVFVLETAELAKSRGVPIYGRILGFGLNCDAYHISSPDKNIHTASRAIKQCLTRSNLTIDAIDYIHAHGTSTKLNDLHEAELIDSLFFHRVAVSSTKGATGHTLGASGAIGTAFSFMALKHGYLPPCVGLDKTDFHLDLVTQSRRTFINNTLCLGFGFGGQNAVLAIGK